MSLFSRLRNAAAGLLLAVGLVAALAVTLVATARAQRHVRGAAALPGTLAGGA